MTVRMRALVLALALGGGVARAQEPPSAAPSDGPSAQRVTLSDAVARAVARHPNTAVARAEVRRAAAIVEEVRAGSLPTLTGNVTYTRLDDDRMLGGRVISAADQLSASVSLVVPLVAPPRWAQWSHAEDGVATARAGAAEARWQVAAVAARAWLTVLAQHRTVESLEHARRTATAHRDFAHLRFASGVGNRIDEVRAAQELATAEAQLESVASSLARAREALGVLTGIDGPVDTAAEPALAGDASAAPGALRDAVGRPDVRTAEARLTAAHRVARDSWTDYLPTLLGVVQPFYQNPPTLTQPLTGWQAQLVLSVPFYDGGLRYGQARERRALQDEAAAQLDAVVRQARSDVRAAAVAIRLADASLAAARDAAALADEALQLANVAYRAGVSTNLEVIDAESRARDTATRAVVAEDAARQARLDLLIASGRLP